MLLTLPCRWMLHVARRTIDLYPTNATRKPWSITVTLYRWPR